MTVFNKNAADHLTAKMFFDPNGSMGIPRYDTVKYPLIKRLAKTQRSFYWVPEEVDINKDRTDFQKLTPHEQHIFTSNLARQVMIDGIQGRAPTEMFNPITSLPEVENFVVSWAFFEQIHSESYTHIIQNIYPSPSFFFDQMKEIPEIMECAYDISKYYDDFGKYSLLYRLLGVGTHTINGEEVIVDLYELKKKLWLMIMSINIMEGLRFYVSFACSWAFAESSKMESNAKIIRFIARDENQHLVFTQKLLKTILVKDDPDYIKIRDETIDICKDMFNECIEQEKRWAKYLFKDGSMVGLNEELLCDYVDYLANTRMKAVGLTPDFKAPTSNPLPWTNSWISSASVQDAPQEVEKSSYRIGGVKQDAEQGDFGGFSL